MDLKLRALTTLTKAGLIEVGERLGVRLAARLRVDELRVELAQHPSAPLAAILAQLKRDQLKAMCGALGLPGDGREKQVIIDRILSAQAAAGERDSDEQLPLWGASTAATAEPDGGLPGTRIDDEPVPAPVSASVETALEPEAAPADCGDGRRDAQPVTVDESAEPDEPVVGSNGRTVTLEVAPRQPRLAWQGMERREAAVSVPTQVVEIVHPGRAVERGTQLPAVNARAAGTRADAAPPNRLIWTNDNVVALRTLLDETDPETGGYRYRGKVDLVYIDPPFMVNSDFQADNAIDIEIDGEEGVQARKEPSLVELLAYRDTWRQGLDSFLAMIRERLVLLKELLAPAGSIYVHLDWHAVHYVKVLMDEVFGYECFRNEIVWKRTSARSDSQGFNHVHDVVLCYGLGSEPWWIPQYGPFEASYIRSHYSSIDERTGQRYTLDNLTSPNPRPNMTYVWKGYAPPANGWRFSRETMAEMDARGLIHYPEKGGRPRYKRFLSDDGMPLQSVWDDIPPVNSQAADRLGYPTQKPVALLERIISASCPPGGLVLDCFMGSGTTVEAAERLGRRWIGIDNGKYAVHLARKRLIQLHGQDRPPEKVVHDYVECEHCKNIERKEKKQRSPGKLSVRPFTIENMGVYQRAEQWQDFQTQRSVYRDEMVLVYGGDPVRRSPLLHGRKGDAWVHIGPLDGPVSVGQVWSIAREAAETDLRTVHILSADFDTLSGSEKDAIQAATRVTVSIRVIPASAIDEVKRRIDARRSATKAPLESMAIPAFYAPLSIVIRPVVDGRHVTLHLERCEVDAESFLASQRPALAPLTDKTSAAKRKKIEDERAKWAAREAVLRDWLAAARTWEKFVDFWAVDWDYGRRVGEDTRPIFETAWQSFRTRRSKKDVDPLVLTAELRYEQPGTYRIAARVTDVFGNDGIATTLISLK
ncbi:MAG: hypothetical protein AMXMBFR64_00230 [Myxococcales bacterium]